MKRRLGFAACLVGVALVILSGWLTAILRIGTDNNLYDELQMKAGILESAGISEEDLYNLDASLAAYLRGRHLGEKVDTPMALAPTVVVFGERQSPFNERELTHLEDCRKLFDLARAVQLISAALGVLLIVLGWRWLKSRRAVRLAACLGPLVLAVPLGIFAIWAAVDFNAAFRFFHEMLFTNDLWLLDPATDLLIRICPQSMFMNMGLRIGLTGLIWTAFVPLVISMYAKERNK